MAEAECCYPCVMWGHNPEDYYLSTPDIWDSHSGHYKKKKCSRQWWPQSLVEVF